MVERRHPDSAGYSRRLLMGFSGNGNVALKLGRLYGVTAARPHLITENPFFFLLPSLIKPGLPGRAFSFTWTLGRHARGCGAELLIGSCLGADAKTAETRQESRKPGLATGLTEKRKKREKGFNYIGLAT
ncbi:hypothetical protein [Bifidobacterium aerophilum]|uniref:Uncharacterized protein n=1 Tax=Bifidobacterium aerophilum TaxID=1798155 RepID=A0A6N9Z400_9BIFI|nr:hypothetical protein [Bifidobacterium aerophilum]NEG89074.1 hypothetical protein [Bifidobacterium aerophilum]